MGDTTKTSMVHNAFFEDDNADRIFYYTGKSNVKGLQAPDHVFLNEKPNRYLRVVEITMPVVGDTGVMIDEDLTLSFMGELDDSGNRRVDNAVRPYRINMHLTGYRYDHYDIFLDGLLEFTIPQELLPDYPGYADYDYAEMQEEFDSMFILHMDSITNEDGSIVKKLSVWVDLQKLPIQYMVTYVNKSLAANFTPMNGDTYFPGLYYVEYLNSKNVVIDTNATDTPPVGNVDSMFVNCTSISDLISKYEIHGRVDRTEDWNRQYVVVYDPLFVPTDTEQIMEWDHLKSMADDYTEKISLSYGDNMTTKPIIKPNMDGLYELQLKNGLYLIQGESRVDINVYINDEIDEELSLSMYLTSNNEEDARKAIKNTFCSPSKLLQLNAFDNIVIKARCTNPENIVCENETKLLIRAIKGTSFGPVD